MYFSRKVNKYHKRVKSITILKEKEYRRIMKKYRKIIAADGFGTDLVEGIAAMGSKK